MALRTCSECGAGINDAAMACPACGWARRKRGQRILKMLFGTFEPTMVWIVLLSVMVALYATLLQRDIRVAQPAPAIHGLP
jgi:hypothetical protein